MTCRYLNEKTCSEPWMIPKSRIICKMRLTVIGRKEYSRWGFPSARIWNEISNSAQLWNFAWRIKWMGGVPLMVSLWYLQGGARKLKEQCIPLWTTTSVPKDTRNFLIYLYMTFFSILSRQAHSALATARIFRLMKRVRGPNKLSGSGANLLWSWDK